MQLKPGERSILSYFPTSNKAQEAGKDLLDAGFKEIQIHRVSHETPSWQLIPSASGFGDRDYGIAGGHAFLLTLITGDERVDEAVKKLKIMVVQFSYVNLFRRVVS